VECRLRMLFEGLKGLHGRGFDKVISVYAQISVNTNVYVSITPIYIKVTLWLQ